MTEMRFLHEHGRDPGEVEALARFVCSQAVGVPPLAVRVMKPGLHDYPTGVCAWGRMRPDWAFRLYSRRSISRSEMYAITVRTVTDQADCLGVPRVCWHSSKARAMYREMTNEQLDALGDQPEVAAAHAAGKPTFGHWPIYITHDWREAFVHTFAHELSHALQNLMSGKVGSEVRCEKFAGRALDAYLLESLVP